MRYATGSYNFGLGYFSGADSLGDYNFYGGYLSGRYQRGSYNFGVGNEALLGVSGLSTASFNWAAGAGALRNITTGGKNFA